jgi:pimeloyl-ACP methyl ester carboxylesterase
MLTIVLPGLDGTGVLLDRFLAHTGSIPVRAMPLPCDRPRSYEELTDWACTELPREPVVLIGESFSGPLAVLVADRCPHVVGVVLCASFVDAPAPAVLARLPWMSWRPPVWALRLLMTGGDREIAAAVRRAIAQVDAGVLAQRLAAVLRVDVAAELQRFDRPLLCIRARRDRVVPARCTETIRALRPEATFVEIDGPHLLLQACSTEVWHHVGPFLARCASG